MENSYDWLKTGRVVIVDGYCPPLYPKLRFSAERLVRIIERLEGNIVRMQPIGYYAYYPTEHFPVHPELGKRDLLQEVIDLCRPRGIKVIPYIPVGHGFLPYESEKEPYINWAARDKWGRKIRGGWHLGYFKYFALCLNSPYREAIRSIVREIVENYDIDGVYFDGPYQPTPRWLNGPCYCSYCKESFGNEIPDFTRGEDWSRPEVFEYYKWVLEEVMLGTFKDLIGIVKKYKDIPVLFNNGLWLNPRVAMWWGSRIYEVADGFLFEASETPLYKMLMILLGRSTGKYIWSYVGSYTVGVPKHLRSEYGYACKWLSTPVNSEELMADCYTVIASGGSPIFWSANRFYYTVESDMEYLRAPFKFLKKYYEELKEMRPVKFIGLLISGKTADWYLKRSSENPYRYYYQGGFEVLKEAGYQVTPIYDSKLSLEEVKDYSILFLPNVACMSEEEAEIIRKYVVQGGNLLATHETSRYDERGNPYNEPILSKILGFTLEGKNVEEYTNLHLKIVSEHPAVGAFKKGELLPQDHQILRIKTREREVLAVTYRIEFEEEIGPAIIAGSYGRGSVIYIASGLEASYLATRFYSTKRLFMSIVDYLSKGSAPYRLNAPPGVVANLMEGIDGILLHILNYNGTKYKEPFCREWYIPVFDIEVEIKIPKGSTIKSIRLLASNKTPQFEYNEDRVRLRIKRIDLYEAIHVKLS